MKTFLVSLFLIATATWAPAVETQNGLQVAIASKTISRNDTRYSGYFTDRAINRMMGLQIVAKNVASRAMPEGSLEWQILVIKTGYYSSPYSELYTGTEKFAALKTAASNELLVGSAQISGWRDASSQRKDKLEYQIVIKHDGKETARITSTPAFESLARHANKKTPAAP